MFNHYSLFSGDAVSFYRSIVITLACMSLCLLTNVASGAAIYKCKLRDGFEFTDKPCPSGLSESKVSLQPIVQSSQQMKVEAKSGITLSGLPPEDRIKSCEPSVAIAAAEEMVRNPLNLNEPLQLFSPAFALFQNGKKDEAVFWFYAAQLRTRQQLVFEKGDRGQLLAVMQMTMGGPINNYAFQNISKLNQILDKVLKWDKGTPNPFREKARAQKQDKQMDQVYTGFSELKSKLITDKKSLEAAAQKAAPGIEQMNASMRSDRCRKGQPDPAYDNVTQKAEEQLAMDFTIHNNQLIKLTGGEVKASLVTFVTYKHDKNKGKYEFSIPNSKSYYYAIIDVNRSFRKPEFRLACVTTLSMGYREAGKDACTQSTVPLPQ